MSSIKEEGQKLVQGVLVSLASLHRIRQSLQVISFLSEVPPTLDTGRQIRQQVQAIDAALTITVYENRVV